VPIQKLNSSSPGGGELRVGGGEKDILESYKNTGVTILKNFFDYSCEQKLDDAAYIPVVRAIINGIQETMLSSNIA
jgi:hypothetical protein